MAAGEEVSGYTKLSLGGRETYLKTEFDPKEIYVSSLHDVISPSSSLHLSINRLKSNSIVSLVADITVRVEETGQQFDLSLTRSMTSSSEWCIRLDSFVDSFPLNILYICVVVIVQGCNARVERDNLFSSASAPRPSFSFFNTALNLRSCNLFPVLTCSIDVISQVNNRVYMESKELLCLHSPFFTALFYRDFQEGEINKCEIHSIPGETFDICTVFGSLLNAMRGNYSPMVCVLVLADRFCMEKVKKGLETYVVSSDLSFLVSFNCPKWILAADMARCDRLVDALLEKMNRPFELKEFYKDLHEGLRAETRVKIVERLYIVATQGETSIPVFLPSFPRGQKPFILKKVTK